MSEQAELQLRLKAARAVHKDSVAELCELLRGRGWRTARDLRRLRPQWSERFVRLLAGAAGGAVISFPGSPGYRLTAELTAAEIPELEHAAAALLAQAREMARRGIRYRRLAALRRAATALEAETLS